MKKFPCPPLRPSLPVRHRFAPLTREDAMGAARAVQQAEVLQGSDSDSDSDGPVYGGRSDDEGV